MNVYKLYMFVYCNIWCDKGVWYIFFIFFLVILIYGSDCSYCKEGGVSVVLLWGWCLGVGD